MTVHPFLGKIKRATISGRLLIWYNIHVQLIWVGQAASGREVKPMKFSLEEVIMLGMFLLALLTYLKRK
jgi:hypothetical protein